MCWTLKDLYLSFKDTVEKRQFLREIERDREREIVIVCDRDRVCVHV